MNPIFRSIFRQADHPSAQNATEDNSPASFDTSAIPVATLIAFLEKRAQMLRTKAPLPPSPDTANPAFLPARDTTAPPTSATKKQHHAPTHAASIYQRAAAAPAHKKPRSRPNPAAANPANPSTSDSAQNLALDEETYPLSATDLPTLHTLLETLKTLRTESLRLERSTTFLRSLTHAVEQAKTAEDSATKS